MKNSLYISFTVRKLLDNQTIKPEILIQKVSLIALSILLSILLVILGVHQWQVSDPYVKSVLSLNGDSVLGHACTNFIADDVDHIFPSFLDVSQRILGLTVAVGVG